MRRLPVLLILLGCQRERAPTAVEITDRSWTAHAAVIAAGERAATCAEAGAAMQRAFSTHRQAFVDSIALDRDRAKLAEATAYIEAHEGRYKDLASRMEALSDRCADEPAVQAAFDQMATP